jgi:hypothetical protein
MVTKSGKEIIKRHHKAMNTHRDESCYANTLVQFIPGFDFNDAHA